MKNKKGAEFTIGMIIALILGLIVLVVVALGFSYGWNNLWTKMNVFTGGGSLATIGQACKISCSARDNVAFCSQRREISGLTQGQVALINSELDGAAKFENNKGSAEEVSCDVLAKAGLIEKCVNDFKCASYSLGSSGSSGTILSFKGEEDFTLIGNCEEFLDERKERLGIPDKLCYWEKMTEIYDERCDNLDREQISEIFEKKAEYRKLDTYGWPGLNTDGDFCVKVIYDCDEWLKKTPDKTKISPYGFFKTDEPTNFYFNPFLDFNKEFVRSLLIHETLHSIQLNVEEFQYSNIFGGGGAGFRGGFMKTYPEYDDLIKGLDKIYDDLMKLFKDKRRVDLESHITELYECLETKSYAECSGEKKLKEEKVYSDSNGLFKLLKRKTSLILELSLSEDNLYFDFFTNPESEFNIKLDDLREAIESEDFKKFGRLYNAYIYVSKLYELDPRLSEVNRWWLDKTASECEIIETSERAREVFEMFLVEKDIGFEYVLSQRQLQDVMKVAERIGEEEEIYKEFGKRILQLVMNDNLLDDGVSKGYA